MRFKILIISIVFIFLSCENIVRDDLNSYDLIPKNAQVVISVKNLGKLKNSIENNNYLKSVVNSNLTIKDLVTELSKINDDKEILIALFQSSQNLHYKIIGVNILNDSLKSKKLSYENFDMISSDSSYEPLINKNHFSQKFQKINQTNTNFSIALDSSFTNIFLNKIFNNKFDNSSGNLVLNIDASSKLITLNGLADNYSVNNKENEIKLDIQEIKSSEREVYFNFENDLVDDYDLISSSQEKKINIFSFESLDSSVENYKIFQLIEGDKVINLNGYISNFKNEKAGLAFNTKFDTSVSDEIILGPIIVKNHINNTNEVLIQDSKNILYLINNLGQVEWSKKIEGKIIKQIDQIDSYKNGKLQYVFVTNESMHLIDRKGRDVGKFPLKFKDLITKPLAVFDYDKNKNYRLLITQNNELFMFDSKGNRVRGFDYKKRGKIVTQPKHFRIGNKDVIVFKTTDKLTILNRRGAVRINMKKEYNYSSEDIYQHENSLITTTVKNEIIRIDMKGNTKLEDAMPINSKLLSDKSSIFTLQKNILSNSINDVEIPFGKYEGFKIYSGNDKSYLNLFDSQNNKIYLFDENLKSIKGFPISSEENADFIFDKKRIGFSLKIDSKKIIYQSIK